MKRVEIKSSGHTNFLFLRSDRVHGEKQASTESHNSTGLHSSRAALARVRGPTLNLTLRHVRRTAYDVRGTGTVYGTVNGDAIRQSGPGGRTSGGAGTRQFYLRKCDLQLVFSDRRQRSGRHDLSVGRALCECGPGVAARASTAPARRASVPWWRGGGGGRQGCAPPPTLARPPPSASSHPPRPDVISNQPTTHNNKLPMFIPVILSVPMTGGVIRYIL